MTEVEQLAKDFYEFYFRLVGGVTYNGHPMPDWETFSTDPTRERHFKAWLMLCTHATQVLVKPQVIAAAKTQRLSP